MDVVSQFVSMPFSYHLAVGTILRFFMVFYSEFHDSFYDVPYTDVDYKVFSDAARYVVSGQSPYRRHTYRYSPFLAYLMIPNVLVGKHFGKLLFSVFDILVAMALKALVEHQLKPTNDKEHSSRISIFCVLFWLYNPLSIGISTRGNADSMPCFLIIMSIMFLQTDVVKGLIKYVLSGAILGFAIHLRLYPLAFSFPMYLSLGEYKISRSTGIKEGFISLLPNKKQLTLAFSCIITLIALTYGLYLMYGYEFLFETYLYHLFRKDTRHNFSVLFYYSYLTMDQLSFDIVKVMSQIFECIILFVISLTFGCDPKTLPFGLFCQAVIMVAFNTVMTSQYFIWFLSLLPLVIHNFKMASTSAILLGIIWVSAQGSWLFYAYLLEFKCKEVFILIWLKSIVFFCANIYVLGQLIKSYSTGYGFGFIEYVSPDIKNK